MSGDESGEQAVVPDEDEVAWHDRSVYNGCGRCGAMVHDVDRDRHRHWHRTMSRALEDARR